MWFVSVYRACIGCISRVLACLRFTRYIYLHTRVLWPVTALHTHDCDTLLCIITCRNTCNRKCIANVCNNISLHASNLVGRHILYMINILDEVFMVELCHHHVRVWNLEGYHFTLIYFCLATI